MTSKTQQADPLLSPAEAALRLGVSVNTLGSWTRNGALRAATQTRGGQRRYRTSDVEELVRELALAEHRRHRVIQQRTEKATQAEEVDADVPARAVLRWAASQRVVIPRHEPIPQWLVEAYLKANPQPQPAAFR